MILDRLKKHILVDGFHVVVDLENSQGSWIVDAETQKRYLDCYSQFASQALGWNHPSLLAAQPMLGRYSMHKLANSDMYSEIYCKFVEKMAEAAPDFKYFFFIDGGALAVENALKAAFDWKWQRLKSSLSKSLWGDTFLNEDWPENSFWSDVELDVIHLKSAFHGRTGYTLSLTNTDKNKTKYFPKFKWTRITNPAINIYSPDGLANVEKQSLKEAEDALKGGKVAAIIIETIQGEGGDNHFRKEYLQGLRDLADKYEAMLIFDEVQTGMGLTGKMWAYEHFGVVPDMICFGKKTQVCGFCSTTRIDSVEENVFHKSGRINSTWGGNVVDMARAIVVLDTIKNEKLVDNAAETGTYFQDRLKEYKLLNVRGRGLMIAFDLPSTESRDDLYNKLQQNMLILKSGVKSLRLRPHLTINKEDVDQAINFIANVL